MQKLLGFIDTIYPLSEPLKEHLYSVFKQKALRKKEYLLKAGHVCRHIYFIENGLVRCFYLKDDIEVSSWFMKGGDVIASVESFFSQTPSYESIQALEDTTVFYLEHRELEAIYRKFIEFNFVGRILLQKYYMLSEQRLYSLRMQRSQERYDYLLEHHPELILRVPAKYLASYLGITEVTMSKIKSRM